MKLWDKGSKLDRRIEIFTVGTDREIDLHIAEYDVIASIAHAKMLAAVGLITADEMEILVSNLQKIKKEIQEGNFIIEEDFEDVHSKIEFLLIEACGEAGKKIHTARSRNDQVLTALHLYFKDSLSTIFTKVKALFEELLDLAETHEDKFLPGYTHFQQAMPSSFGLWFSAYAELLVDDVFMLKSAYRIVDQNPLGSSAGYGSTFPIDREFTRSELGFGDLKYNVVAAQLSRGKSEMAVSNALSSIASTLNKFATDICIYMSQEFDFISFPETLTTGSSIMPHKKNPDVFELIRARTNKIQSNSLEIGMLTTNLPSGYHRDFQLLKEGVVNSITSTIEILDIFKHAIGQIQINELNNKDEKYKSLYTVNGMNKLVQAGLPFREAYRKVANDIKSGEFEPDYDQIYTHIGSLEALNLDRIREKLPEM